MLIESVSDLFSDSGNEIMLDKILVGVEPIKIEILQRLSEILPNANILNAYGPTENTVVATAHLFDKDMEYKTENVPIGLPLPNCRVYLLDSDKQNVPYGYTGELYLAGKSLSNGYIGHDSECFTFLCNERVYKTGDLARILPNGEILFQGRIDHQFKINGIRIEPGEIEAALLFHPDISYSLVVAKEMSRNDEPEKVLIAYYVSNAEIPFHELRLFLSSKIPANIIPNYFVWMDSVPTTANGKVDRAKLPVPKKIESSLCEPPVSEIEKKIARIWAEVLGLEISQISIIADFFEIGGNSLKLIKLKTIIEREMNIDLPVVDFFNHPSIRELSNIINSYQDVSVEKDLEEF